MRILIVDSKEYRYEMESVCKDIMHWKVDTKREYKFVKKYFKKKCHPDVLFWHLNGCIGCTFNTHENVETKIKEIASFHLPAYRIGVSDGSNFRSAAAKAAIRVNNIDQPCFQIISKWGPMLHIKDNFAGFLKAAVKIIDIRTIAPKIEDIWRRNDNDVSKLIKKVQTMFQNIHSNDWLVYKSRCGKCKWKPGSNADTPDDDVCYLCTAVQEAMPEIQEVEQSWQQQNPLTFFDVSKLTTLGELYKDVRDVLRNIGETGSFGPDKDKSLKDAEKSAWDTLRPIRELFQTTGLK